MLTVGAEQIEQLSRLKDLAHGWDDDEVAPAPSTGAITRALDILTEALRHGLVPFEVDADVLGGVALWYEGNGRRIWIACMNNGKTTALLVDGEQRLAAPYDADDAKGLAAFLMGGFG